eukprot:CAMPEP_0195113614 /NCGR_PEP_ID=MMETSP0448-20130528/103149_1 /TAXON_ID=66468 /ORGANISM="Heterocapsa triquestra, Strain CCMP 448" /LENGTH=202 /DNA_ID=CAMNT_0040150575 /DNA_START=1 /DNA_END=609 /DNA_ORIENTATION=-
MMALEGGGSMPLLFFFGLPGAGKTHCGQLAARAMGYRFCDGDHWLPDDLRASLARGEGFTPTQRDRLATNVATRISHVRAAEGAAVAHGSRARPLAVAQATFKRRHRDMIRSAHPDVVFVWVRAAGGARQARLSAGQNLVDTDLGRRMALDFEPPTDDEHAAVAVIDNGKGADDAALLGQLWHVVRWSRAKRVGAASHRSAL